MHVEQHPPGQPQRPARQGSVGPVGVPYDVYATVGRGQGAALRTSAHLSGEPLIAPLAAGQPVGELTVADTTGEVLARAPLTALAPVPSGGLWTRAMDSVALWFH
ncbi:MAG: hypothetical protein E6K44_00525 [Gammaproteobacteria bacterium]|nr:MAG: hypothetical protein E6K44_00525 [Gammaproteobacteria bacterium]